MTPPDGRSTAHKLALIIPAAGSSTRMGGDTRKPLIEILGLPVLCHTLKRFHRLDGLTQVIIVAHAADVPRIRASHWHQLHQFGATHLVTGGARRQDSVARGLDAVHADVDIVLIHDAVRPFVPRRAIEEAVRAAARSGAAIVAMPVTDTVKRADDAHIVETVPRDRLWCAQTPQVFQTAVIRRAIDEAVRSGFDCTDDAQLAERIGVRVELVTGSFENFKITTPEHLRMAEALLARPENR